MEVQMSGMNHLRPPFEFNLALIKNCLVLVLGPASRQLFAGVFSGWLQQTRLTTPKICFYPQRAGHSS